MRLSLFSALPLESRRPGDSVRRVVRHRQCDQFCPDYLPHARLRSVGPTTDFPGQNDWRYHTIYGSLHFGETIFPKNHIWFHVCRIYKEYMSAKIIMYFDSTLRHSNYLELSPSSPEEKAPNTRMYIISSANCSNMQLQYVFGMNWCCAGGS